MAMFTDGEIVLATGARILQQGRKNIRYSSIETDTRTIGEDVVFVALEVKIRRPRFTRQACQSRSGRGYCR